MNEPFLQRITYNYFGAFYRILLAILTAAVLVRAIGTQGYAVIGIAYAFISALLIFDVPFFLSHLKNSKDALDHGLFTRTFNTLYISLIVSNVGLLIFLLPLLLGLAFFAYKDPSLSLFMILALCVQLLQRTEQFFEDFLRANRNERIVQQANVSALTIEFVLILVFLALDFGVLSVFIASLIAKLVQLCMLIHKVKTSGIVCFERSFSWRILKGVLRRSAIPNYVSKILRSTLFRGGFLASSFILDRESIGILTLFFSNLSKLFFLSSPLWNHISPIFAEKQKKHALKKSLAASVTYLLLSSFSLLLIFFITFGSFIFKFYYGPQVALYYSHFVVLMSGICLSLCFCAFQILLFVRNTALYNKALAVIVPLFFVLLVPLALLLGLWGAIASYAIAYISLSLLCVYLSRRNLPTLCEPAVLSYFWLSLVLLGITVILILHHL